MVFLPNLAKRLFGDTAGKSGGLGGRERSSSEEIFMWFIPVCSVWDPRTTQTAHRHANTDTLSSRVPSVSDARKYASFLACLIQDARRTSMQLLNSGTGAADVSRRHPAAWATASTPLSQTTKARVSLLFHAHMNSIFASENKPQRRALGCSDTYDAVCFEFTMKPFSRCATIYLMWLSMKMYLNIKYILIFRVPLMRAVFHFKKCDYFNDWT